jgi:hypothetical protein
MKVTPDERAGGAGEEEEEEEEAVARSGGSGAFFVDVGGSVAGAGGATVRDVVAV